MRWDRYRIYILYVLLFVLQVSVFAGTTGKIAGKVVDKETGEPLPGVNVVVKGTTMGAATDFDGFYTILNVQPGTHALTASMVGYRSVTIEDVRVRIDQTSPVDISLAPEAVEITDIVVTAQKNELKKDVSTSVVAVQSAEIETLPVTSVAEVVTLQAGVEEGMAIRGGTSDQNLLMVDGITQRDPRDNSPISSVALTSIQEVNVEKGGFNAEYGQVRSGIINIVAKEGGVSNYSGAIQVKYSPASPKYFGMSIYDPNSMFNKPYLDNSVAWKGTQNGGWDYYTQRQYPRFPGWNAVSQTLLSDNDPNNDLSPAAAQRVWQYLHRRTPKTNQPDYNIDASFGGPVPVVGKDLGNLRFFTSYMSQREMLLVPLSRDDYQEWNWSMKMNSDITDAMKLQLSASTGKYYTVGVNFEEAFLNNAGNFGVQDGINPWSPTMYFRSPASIAQMFCDLRDSKVFMDSWYSAAEVGHLTLSGKLTGFINSSTFYEVGVEHVNRKYQTGPIAARDTSRNFELLPGVFVDSAPFGFDSRPTYGIYQSVFGDFFLGGHTGEMYDSTKVKSYKVKFDLTSQINNENMVKFGIEFSTYNLDLNYGYEMKFFGDANHVKETWDPYQLGMYLQDKIEMYGFIANLGLRMDLSNPNTEWANVNAFDKSFFSGDYKEDNPYSRKKAVIDVAFSPRLGISHPITENSKLYFNYGHFKQLPAYQEIFRIGRGSTGAVSNFGNPNLIQAKTVAYELGYDHVLFDSYLLQIQAFYRDISDVQGYTFINSGTKGIGYNLANNNSYADTRGVEVTFKKTDGDWIRGFLTFTYQLTTNGAFGNSRIDDDPVEQRKNDQNTQALYQTRPVPQPRSRASVTFLTPKDFGPAFSGFQPIGGWALNILGDWQAGQYINYNPLQVRELQNVPNVQVTDYINFDLRLNKTFDFNMFNVMFFVEVKNLLNTKRLSGASFMDGFDQIDYYSSLHLPESSAYDNIPGNDRIGDYRKGDVKFQPIESVPSIASVDPSSSSYAPRINAGAIFYDKGARKYYEYKNSNWAEVESSRMNKILDDKAYIDMPNNTSFNFLNPRQVFFGINLSFKL